MNKVTIRPRFSETVLIFNHVSRKKIIVLPGRPFIPLFGLVSRICPDLPTAAAVCLHIDGSDFI